MNFEALQKTWQAPFSRECANFGAELILKGQLA